MFLKVSYDPTVTPPSLKACERHAWYLEKSTQKDMKSLAPMTQKAMGAKKLQSVPIKCPGKSLQ